MFRLTGHQLSKSNVSLGVLVSILYLRVFPCYLHLERNPHFITAKADEQISKTSGDPTVST